MQNYHKLPLLSQRGGRGMKITGQDFFHTFKELFQTIYEKSPDEILSKYKKRNPWTDLMLNGKKAFLPHVVYDLGNSKLVRVSPPDSDRRVRLQAGR